MSKKTNTKKTKKNNKSETDLITQLLSRNSPWLKVPIHQSMFVRKCTDCSRCRHLCARVRAHTHLCFCEIRSTNGGVLQSGGSDHALILSFCLSISIFKGSLQSVLRHFTSLHYSFFQSPPPPPSFTANADLLLCLAVVTVHTTITWARCNFPPNPTSEASVCRLPVHCIVRNFLEKLTDAQLDKNFPIF
jgi:hypothetical protein